MAPQSKRRRHILQSLNKARSTKRSRSLAQVDNQYEEKVAPSNSILDGIMYAPKDTDWKTGESNLRTLVMKGDSERNLRYRNAKAQEFAREAKSMLPITSFFYLASGALSAVPEKKVQEE